METLLIIHSHTRWLVLFFVVAAILKLSLLLVRKQKYTSVDTMLVRVYGAILSLQWLIGLIMLISRGADAGWDMAIMRLQIEHGTTMTLALVCAHFVGRWKKAADAVRARNTLIFLLLSLVLILVGIVRIRGMEFLLGGH